MEVGGPHYELGMGPFLQYKMLQYTTLVYNTRIAARPLRSYKAIQRAIHYKSSLLYQWVVETL